MFVDAAIHLVKDKLIAQALRTLLDTRLEGLGSVSDIDFHSMAKTFTVTFCMVGESRPVVVRIDSYTVKPNAAGSKWVIHEYSSPSHKWIAGLAKKFQPSFEVELPVPYLIAKSLI